MVMLTISLMLAVFIMALDTTILSTAVPSITSNFHSINDIGWYSGAYLLPLMSLQPTFGKVYSFFNIKAIFIGALVVFEAGSIICATAPSSSALIVGRAVAGLGAAAIYSGGMTIIGFSVPLSRISIFLATLSSMSAIASVAGPPLGGVFTDSRKLTWRFCFWINLPFGGMSVLMFMLAFRAPARQAVQLKFHEKVARMDLGGTSLFISSMVCLFLALQWGGIKYSWSDSRVWGLVLGFGLLMIAFVVLQLYLVENATIPPRIFRRRSVTSSLLVAALISTGFSTHTYYLPFYFQSAKGTTAAGSGVRLLPSLLSLTVAELAVGSAVTVLGIYLPFIWTGTALFTIAAGLLCTLAVGTSAGRLVGYQILAGAGVGSSMQLCATAVRASVDEKDIPTASALSVFAPFFGGSLAASIAQNIFRSALVHSLQNSPLKAETATIVAAGARAGVNAVPDSLKETVMEAYNYAVTRSFIFAAVSGGLGFLCSLGIKWRNIKEEKNAGDDREEEGNKDGTSR
ncbi:MFS general substrate transporter [Glonium stellatum]|uniref:MFS general substrate transporter n=1 Tax=Glonium stellatum TaxID=574774 RepID=A0A8E2JP10_9PEZI|nr:MFS general substrate transporter [Glonium stellatum]